MVLFFENTHEYNHDFQTVSLAYFNRYPNPFAKHVLSSDTLEQGVDNQGCFQSTRLVVKTGRLPGFIKPFLGSNLNSWIMEKVVVDPTAKTLHSYTANVDHRKFMKVEEYLTYTDVDGTRTLVESKVKFSSNLVGFKQKIEEWGRNRFSSNMSNTREGLKFVMNRLKERGGIWYREPQVAQ